MSNPPIRILHVLKGMNRGGIETWLMHVLRNIDRERYRFDFLTSTTEKCAYDDELLEMGCKIIPCLTPRNPLQYAGNFKRLVRENGPYDILHSHVHHFSGFTCMLGKRAGIPMRIAHSHSDTSRKEQKAIIARRAYLRTMEWMIRKYATHGIACSALAAEDLFGANWSSDPRRQLLYCGVDMKPFEGNVNKAAARKEFGFPSDAIILGHVGRFADMKNHTFLIDVVAAAVRMNPKCRALLVGDGPLRPAIEAKVKTMGLQEHVAFAGLRDDIPRLMKGSMDVFVFPSLHEGLPLVLVEAQTAGLQCITSTAVPNEAAVVEGAVEYLNLEQTPEEWAQTALSAIKNPLHNPAAALECVSNSKFNIDKSVQHLRETYQNVIRKTS